MSKKKIREIKDGFVRPTAEEIQEEISGKVAERLKIQEMFREAVLKRHFQESYLEDFGKELKRRMDAKEEGAFQFCGSHYSSLKNALCDFHLADNSYSQILKQENYLRKALKNEGLTDDQISQLVIDGKLVKYVSEKQRKKESTDIKGPDYLG